jgi:hypothetical protein
MGRNRLDLLDRKIADRIEQQAAWFGVQEKVREAADMEAKAREVDSYIRLWYSSPYRISAERLLRELRDERLRKGGNGR